MDNNTIYVLYTFKIYHRIIQLFYVERMVILMPISIRNKFHNLVNESEYNSYKKIVEQINLLNFDSLNNTEFLNKSHELRSKLLEGSIYG